MWLAYDRQGESPSLLTMTVGVEWNCLGRLEKVWRVLEVRIVVLENISCEGWTRGPYTVLTQRGATLEGRRGSYRLNGSI
jgi:hypothetical protein